MRQLITNDLYRMSRILKKLSIKASDLKIDNESKDFDQELMVELMLKIAENLHMAQDEINDFIGSLCGMTGEEFGALPFKQSMELVKEFKTLEGVTDFFERAGQLTT